LKYHSQQQTTAAYRSGSLRIQLEITFLFFIIHISLNTVFKKNKNKTKPINKYTKNEHRAERRSNEWQQVNDRYHQGRSDSHRSRRFKWGISHRSWRARGQLHFIFQHVSEK